MLERDLYAPLAEEALCVTVVSFVPRARGRMDVDNLVKGLPDSLQGVLYVNDRQIQCLTSRGLLTGAAASAYLLSAQVVYPYEIDVVHEDRGALKILSGPRLNP